MYYYIDVLKCRRGRLSLVHVTEMSHLLFIELVFSYLYVNCFCITGYVSFMSLNYKCNYYKYPLLNVHTHCNRQTAFNWLCKTITSSENGGQYNGRAILSFHASRLCHLPTTPLKSLAKLKQSVLLFSSYKRPE